MAGSHFGRIITRKTYRLYEQYLKEPHEIPLLQVIFDFMKRKFQSLETLAIQELLLAIHNKHTKHVLWARYIIQLGDVPSSENYPLKND
ncbi:hypothetical protein JTB14_030773 [Gonioctena quinquepunctata]|nr:hypothetical protein JTB14_030773 [Gonioctena quinquepunctata]